MKSKPMMAGVILVLAGAAWGQAAAPGTEPATQPANPVVAKLNTMPKELWPVKGETTAREQARQKWVETAFPKGTPVKGVVGSLVDSQGQTVAVFNPGPRPAGFRGLKPDSYKSVQEVQLTAQQGEVWGATVKVTVRAEVDVPAQVAQGWMKQQTLSLDGPIGAVQAYGGSLVIDLGLCTLTPPPKAPSKPSTRPAPKAATLPKTGSQL